MVRCVTGAARPAAAGIGAFFKVTLDDLAQKVAGFVFFGCGWGRRLSHAVILGGLKFAFKANPATHAKPSCPSNAMAAR
jgi:hypothetical protein